MFQYSRMGRCPNLSQICKAKILQQDGINPNSMFTYNRSNKIGVFILKKDCFLKKRFFFGNCFNSTCELFFFELLNTQKQLNSKISIKKCCQPIMSLD